MSKDDASAASFAWPLLSEEDKRKFSDAIAKGHRILTTATDDGLEHRLISDEEFYADIAPRLVDAVRPGIEAAGISADATFNLPDMRGHIGRRWKP